MTVKGQCSAKSGATTRRNYGRRRIGIGGTKIDQRKKKKFQEWRQRIKMVPALRDLDDILDEDSKPANSEDRGLASWKRRDTKASAIIKLTLRYEQLENVSGSETTAETGSTL